MHNTSISTSRTKVFVLLVLVLICLCQVRMCCGKHKHKHISVSPPSSFTVSSRCGTKNKAIIHSGHAYVLMLVLWASSLLLRLCLCLYLCRSENWLKIDYMCKSVARRKFLLRQYQLKNQCFPIYLIVLMHSLLQEPKINK